MTTTDAEGKKLAHEADKSASLANLKSNIGGHKTIIAFPTIHSLETNNESYYPIAGH